MNNNSSSRATWCAVVVFNCGELGDFIIIGELSNFFLENFRDDPFFTVPEIDLVFVGFILLRLMFSEILGCVFSVIEFEILHEFLSEITGGVFSFLFSIPGACVRELLISRDLRELFASLSEKFFATRREFFSGTAEDSKLGKLGKEILKVLFSPSSGLFSAIFEELDDFLINGA